MSDPLIKAKPFKERRLLNNSDVRQYILKRQIIKRIKLARATQPRVRPLP